MMKYILVLIMIVPLTSWSQDVELSEKENKIVELIKLCRFHQNIHGPVFFDVHDYKANRIVDGRLVFKPITKHSPEIHAAFGEEFEYFQVEETHMGTYVSFYDECGSQASFTITKWKENKPVKFQAKVFIDGQIIYDSEGRMKCILQGIVGSGSGKKKKYYEDMFCVEYGDDMKISSAGLLRQMYKGKERNKLSKDFLYNEQILEYTQNGNLTSLNHQKFRLDGKEAYMSQEKAYAIEITENGVKENLVWKNIGPNNTEKKSTTTTEESYDDKLRLVERKVHSDLYINTYEYNYDERDNLIGKLEHRTDAQNNSLRKVVINNRFDQAGLKITTVKETFKDGALSETMTSKFSYDHLEPGFTINRCKSLGKVESSFTNAEGIVFKESKDGKIRVKKDGVWGEWKYPSM